MSQNGLPPPPPECLWRPHSSNPDCKGGTLIVGDVHDREGHARRRCCPDGYRPRACPRCGHDKLHVHDYPERKRLVLVLVRYLCAACGATWRMLPLFVARMLWRDWPTVEEEALGPEERPLTSTVPEKTRQRWRGRLATAAALLLGVLRKSPDEATAAVAAAVEDTATRRELLVAYAAATGAAAVGERLARLAAVVHELAPGVRIM